MTEQAVRHIHRLCPCACCDVEGIQSWLEDMAANGFFLIRDGVFCGIFSFERRAPQQTTYRLDVAQKRKPRFWDSGSELTEDELELYRSMGWEYLLCYGDFRIYRSMESDSPELNTEGETHAITISLLKQKYRNAFIYAVLTALFWLVFAQSALHYSFRIAASIGVVFLLCIHGVMLDAWITQLLRLFRFRGYEKRLRSGDSLNHRINWKQKAFANYCARVLPILLSLGIAVSLLVTFARSDDKIPCRDYPGDPPFATVADVFPGGTITGDDIWMDYGTYKTSQTAVSRNIEWNESCDVQTTDSENYFCILRLTYHETVSDQIARGLERDYYVYDSTRYHGKRFEDLPAPELGVDSIRVYSNYGSLSVLMREDNRIIHAVVVMDNQTNANQWHLWAQAMADMLNTKES